ncbi:hypothetical protein Gotur_027084 [Gossypium turneri]
MANEFLDKVEDNAIVRIWSEKVQLEKGDSLAKDYVSELWDYTLDHIQDQAKWGVQMYSMKESARLDSSTSGWKKEGRSVCFER